MAGFEDIDDDMEKASGENFKKEDLRDGEYVVEIAKAEATSAAAGPMAKLQLRIVSGGPDEAYLKKIQGKTIDQVYFFMSKVKNGKPGETAKNEVAINNFKRDFKMLGMDLAEYAAAGHKFSAVVEPCVAVAVGMRVLIKKSQKDDTDKNGQPVTYHNLYLNKRAADDGKPLKLSYEELVKAAPELPF